MEQEAIIRYVVDTFAGVDVVRPSDGVAAGDTFFVYDPDRDRGERWMPFATIVTRDYGDFDRSSNLDRPGVFRLNIGVGRETFRALFGQPPGRDAADRADADHDFAALDRLLPHPTYAAQSWVCVLNPGAESFERVKPLLAEAYELAAGRHARRGSSSG
jgi:hypothetical protein